MTIASLFTAALWLALFTTRATASRIALSLPATAMHELAHWVVALVTGSRPGFPSLWPRRQGTTWVLGSVAFQPGGWTAGWVALAPFLVLAPLAYWGLRTRLPGSPVEEAVAGILCGYAIWGCVPSSTDFEIAFKYPLGTLIAGVGILGVLSLHWV